MLVKQFTIRAFEIEIENEAEFIDFFEKNKELLKKYFVIVNGIVTSQIKELLEKEEILYTIGSLKDNSFIKNAHIQKIKTQNKECSKVINFPIRSGMEIESDSDIILLKRANSASIIKTKQNFIALDVVEGRVECEGEFMFLKASSKALILFRGKDISEYLQKERFYSVYFNENEKIEIKEFTKGSK